MSWDMDEIKPHHLAEWVDGSGISEEIARANLVSLEGDDALAALVEARLETMGGHAQQYVTAPVSKLLKRFANAADGGWWCATQAPSQSCGWGCLKPDNPRTSDEGKLIKYEHPLGVDCGVFYLKHPDQSYWEIILANPATYTVTITEGAKKAAALMSCGIPAVALPGIWNGTPLVDPNGPKDGRRMLHPDLFPLRAHRLVILFDYSESNRGRAAVNKAAYRLADHLYGEGCPMVSFTCCPGPHKGIDDVLVKEGRAAVHNIVAKAKPVAPDPKERPSAWKIRKDQVMAAAGDDPIAQTNARMALMREAALDIMQAVVASSTNANPSRPSPKTFGLQLQREEVDAYFDEVDTLTSIHEPDVEPGNEFTTTEQSWVLHEIFLLGLNLFVGMPGAGKSSMLVALMRAFLTGQKTFLQRNPPRRSQTPRVAHRY